MLRRARIAMITCLVTTVPTVAEQRDARMPTPASALYTRAEGGRACALLPVTTRVVQGLVRDPLRARSLT